MVQTIRLLKKAYWGVSITFILWIKFILCIIKDKHIMETRLPKWQKETRLQKL